MKSAKYAAYVAITAGNELKEGDLMKHANINDIPTYCRGFLAERAQRENLRVHLIVASARSAKNRLD